MEKMSKSEAGRMGGKATVRKYGRGYMSRIGKRGARVFWSRYFLTPVGVSNFAIVSRETKQIVGYMNPTTIRSGA